MTVTTAQSASSNPNVICFTRCPVPTATGVAYKLGWLDEAFAQDGIALRTLQENAPELASHHYDHRLPTLIREGGNMLAIAARAQGENTRLVGLTWIEESQLILTRPETGIRSAADLKGRRLGLPTWTSHAISSHLRGSSIGRGMSLHGYKGALASAGLTFDDVDVVEVEPNIAAASPLDRLWPFDALRDGRVDAIYVKGAAALDTAKAQGLVIAVNLDLLPDPRHRVNNGTPRPITVHQDFIDHHFDLLVRFLAVTLRAADWAVTHVDALYKILEAETGGSRGAVADAYGSDFHKTLHPSLDASRLALFEQQKTFLFLHGFLDADVTLAEWIDPRPLEAARALVELGGIEPPTSAVRLQRSPI